MSQASTQKRIIRAVALDIDGTLICRDGTVCLPNHEAIIRLSLAQVPVILATGRIPCETMAFYRQLELTTPLVCYHGALVLNSLPVPGGNCNNGHGRKAENPPCGDPAQPVLFDAPLPGSVARDLVQFITEIHAQAQILIGTSDRYLINRMGQLAEYWDMKGPSRPLVGPLDDTFGQAIYKVCYFSSDLPQVGEVVSRVNERFGPVFQHQQAHDHLAEFLSPGVSKAAGVEMALKQVGREWDETMAIGDFHNDMEMVRRAAVGVAMANACPELKAIADYITGDRDEGGVAEAIDRFVKGA